MGLELDNLENRGLYRTYVKRVLPGSVAEKNGVTVGSFLVTLNGRPLEGFRAVQVLRKIKEATGAGIVVLGPRRRWSRSRGRSRSCRSPYQLIVVLSVDE